MIKTVLFDLGNVILPFDVTRLAARLAPFCSLAPKEIIELLWDETTANQFETGLMSGQQYFDDVVQRCGFKELPLHEFTPLFNDIFVEDSGVVNLIARLKKNYRLGLISNTNPIHVAHIKENYPSVHHFEKHWWSHEAGVRKPDPAIYRMALSHFDVQPEEAVFIDDMPINISSANNIGMHGILYRDVASLEQELTKRGVVH